MKKNIYNHAIIVAGGMGKRFKNNLPKQYVKVNGVPIIIHTLRAFLDLENVNIIVVIPENDNLLFENMLNSYEIDKKSISTVNGGNERFFSVKNALVFLEYKKKIIQPHHHYIAIHDAARPLVSKQTILKSFQLAYKNGSAIASISMTSSLRKIEIEKSKPVNRKNYKIINTPQTFRYDWLLNAYKNQYIDSFTDDATVVEYEGYPISLFEDSPNNIKITVPDDLLIVKALLKNSDKKQ